MLAKVRYGLLGFLLGLLSLIFSVIFLFRPFHRYNAHMMTSVLRTFAFRLLGIRVEARGLERLATESGKIVIGNHQQGLDLYVFGCLLPRGTLVIGKQSLAWVPFFGWAYYLSGQFFINRKNHVAAMRTMARVKEQVLERGLAIFMMPEGTRRYSEGLGPFKKGAFRLAIEAQVPIFPMVANSFYKSIDMSRWRSGSVIVSVLPPIPTQGLGAEDVDALMAQAHDAMTREIQALDAELALSLKSPV